MLFKVVLVESFSEVPTGIRPHVDAFQGDGGWYMEINSLQELLALGPIEVDTPSERGGAPLIQRLATYWCHGPALEDCDESVCRGCTSYRGDLEWYKLRGV